MIEFMKRQAMVLFYLLVSLIAANAQNPKIKCYFNHPVNNALSTGTNAVYLNGKFPDTIVSYINNAKYTLDFAVYNFLSNGSDATAKIATAVNNAYKRGVVVRWVADGTTKNTGLSLLDAGIPIIKSPTSPGYTIMHNKFLVVDVNSPDTNDAYLLTGSYNYSVQQSVTDYNNIIILHDQKVANAYYSQFNQMWGGTGNLPDTTKSLFGSHKKTSTAHYFNVGGTKVQVHFSPKDSCNKYLTAVANSASNDLTVGIYTFTDNSVANTILNRFNAKVNVRAIMDVFSKNYTPYTTLGTTLGNNLVVYNGSGLYHSKIMIADALLPSSDPQVATGSYNWTVSATNSNDENLLIIHDADLANQYYQAVCNDISVNGGNACVTPLPLNFVFVNAIINANKKVNLTWATSGASNNDHFDIEHLIDGKNYEKIGNISLKQKGLSENSYLFTDNTPNEGENYYRIKQVDNDGNFSFSKIVSVYLRTGSSLKLFPNPASNQLQITLPVNANWLTIYDASNRKVLQLNTHQKATALVDITRLAKGVYFLEIETTTTKITKQFVNQ